MITTATSTIETLGGVSSVFRICFLTRRPKIAESSRPSSMPSARAFAAFGAENEREGVQAKRRLSQLTAQRGVWRAGQFLHDVIVGF